MERVEKECFSSFLIGIFLVCLIGGVGYGGWGQESWAGSHQQ